MRNGIVLQMIFIGIFVVFGEAVAFDYHVGHGQEYVSIGSVPWYSLVPGDNVYIHPGIYHEKFQVSTRGTEDNPIRVIGLLDENGERPIIDGEGATTSANNHFHWQAPNLVQWSGLIFISINSDEAPLPANIQIKNLEVRNAFPPNNFVAENGSTQTYDGFAAGIYIRSAENVLIDNCVIHDNGQAVYNWTGSGEDWWDGLAKNITIRGNYFYNNGQPNSWTEHQTYTEADGVTIEHNRYGPMRVGAWGSHLKDRSSGTVIRYNYFETAPAGWVIDMVEPENGYDGIALKNEYKQTFVYGNLIVNDGNYNPNYFHWNEDHQVGVGRATVQGAKLLFYNNTVITIANQSDIGWDEESSKYELFNSTYGSYDCPPGTLPGMIDVRNNIFLSHPRTFGQPVPKVQFGYCGKENFNFVNNWITPGYIVHGAVVNGTESFIVPPDNDPGFVDFSSQNYRPAENSSARGIGGILAPEVTNNYLDIDMSPIAQYQYHQQIETRSGIGVGSDAGAFGSSHDEESQTFSLSDFIALKQAWLTPGSGSTDINQDNIVNARDLGIMMSNW